MRRELLAYNFDTLGANGSSSPAGGRKRRVAVVGSGISGLSAAWALQHDCDVTVLEKSGRIGGHTNTVIIDTPDGPLPVDTGFIVYNEPNYPNLTALFKRLGVATNDTRMHFSVSARERDMEYASHSVGGLFADLRNVARPRFYSMLSDLMRFHSAAPKLANSQSDVTIGEFLETNGYGKSFASDHLLPMAAAIWSCPTSAILDFPARSLARFFVNHGLAELRTAFPWKSVDGGSHSYIAPLIAGFADKIQLNTEVIEVVRRNGRVFVSLQTGETLEFDDVILACHGPQSRSLLGDADATEAGILDAFRTQANKAVLHTDPALMPKRHRAWASWNYLSEQGGEQELSVTYWMNALQKLDTEQNYFVTLNPAVEPVLDQTIAEFNYHHPIFDAASFKAQRDIWDIQGNGHVWYCGAWLGYGFHEDGLQAGLAVAELMSDWRRPWTFDYASERLARDISKLAIAV